MDDKIKKMYEYLIDVYGQAKAAATLAEKIYLDYDNNSQVREMQIILITALFHSAAVNISRILDHDENGINVYKFLDAYCASEKSKVSFMVDLAAIGRLKKRRNKSLVHADKINLSPDIDEKLPLYIGDLNSILKSLENLLFPLAREIVGRSVAGINQQTKEWDFKITRDVENQYNIFKKMLSDYKQMAECMRESLKKEINHGQP